MTNAALESEHPGTNEDNPSSITTGTESNSCIAAAPFDKRSTDAILRTIDNVEFHVRKAILEESSTVFADMFSMPQSQQRAVDGTYRPSDPLSGGIQKDHGHGPDVPVIRLTEPSSTIDPLLRFCYPVADPHLSTLEELKPLLAATRKYQMDYALECLKPRLLHFAQSSPLPVYAIALRYELKDVVLGAAKLFLRLHAPYPYTEELEEITGGAYHRLLKYRDSCSAAATGVIDGKLEWFDDPDCPWFTRGGSCRCPYGTVHKRPKGSLRGCSAWFLSMLTTISSLLAKRPCREAIEEPTILDNALVIPMACDVCRSVTSGKLRGFMVKLADEVDKKISQVRFKRKVDHRLSDRTLSTGRTGDQVAGSTLVYA